MSSSVAEESRGSLTPLQIALMALLVLAAVLSYVDRQALVAVSPLLKREFHLSDEEWGWVNSAFALVYVVTSALGGAWIDRVGVRRGLFLSFAFWTAVAAGHAFAMGFWSLCIWRALLGLGEGPGSASLLKGMRRLVPPRLRDTGTGLIGAGTVFGALVTPLIVAPLAMWTPRTRVAQFFHLTPHVPLGWRAAFLVTTALTLIWLPLWAVLAANVKANLGAETVDVSHASDHRPPPLNWRSYALWATIIAVLFTVPPTIFANGFLTIYLTKTFHLSLTGAALKTWQPFLATDIGQLAGGGLAYFLLRCGWRYLSARRLVMTVGLLGSTCLLAMNAAHTAQGAIWVMNCSRFCFQASYTVLLAYGIESVIESQTALMHGLMNATYGAANVIVNPLIGRIADRLGYQPVIVLVGLLPVVGLAGWLVLTHLHARQHANRPVVPVPAEDFAPS